MSRERVIPVPPKSMRQILATSEKFLAEIEPERLRSPGILDFARLIDETLPRRGIDVYGVPEAEILGTEGLTGICRHTPSRIEIVILADYFDALYAGGRSVVRARSTLAHEIGHAKLHGHFLKKVHKLVPQMQHGAVLHRSRGEIPTYKDPEWQAWMFAGAIMMPLAPLRRFRGADVAEIAEAFGTSVDMVNKHVKRVARRGFFLRGGVLEVH